MRKEEDFLVRKEFEKEWKELLNYFKKRELPESVYYALMCSMVKIIETENGI